MKDERRTKKQLLDELGELRRRVAMLEASKPQRWPTTEALRQSEERYRLLAENVTDIIWTMDMNGRFTYVSPSIKRMLGFTVKEAIRGKLERILTPASARTVEQALQEQPTAQKTEKKDVFGSRTVELEFVRKDGSTVWAEVKMNLLPGAKGNPVGILGVARDITERKRAEKALLFAAQEWRDTFDALSDIVYLLDLEGRVLRCNRATTKFLGKPFGEILGRPCWELLHGTSEPLKGCPLVRTRESRRTETSVVSLDDRWFDAVVDPRLDKDGNLIGAVHVMSDITDRKRAEQEKEKLQAELAQAQKMEAIGTLAAGVAHDFNNLLTTIYGNTELALEETPKISPVHANLKYVHDACIRAAALVRQLLVFSRKHPTVFAPRNINKTIEGLLEMLRRIIGEDVAIDADLEPGLWTVRADVGKIEQVIMNLAANAREAMPKGGKLGIKTHNIIVDEKYCDLHPDARPGEFVCLSVHDTGVGMDQGTVRRIFEPFFTTKGVGRGTGLGLSVVYGIVEEHEGWITVESSPRNGSVFEIYLPAVSAKAEEQEKESFSLPELKGQGERVLVVEDEESVGEFARTGLSRNGYEVAVASTAREARELFEKEGRSFDLLFADVVLPDETGPELANMFVKLKPGIGVVLCSGYSDERSGLRAVEKAGYYYLPKPYSLADLLRAAKNALKGPGLRPRQEQGGAAAGNKASEEGY